MIIWITAHYSDGSQILGNGNGQGKINSARPEQTKHYHNIVSGLFRGRCAHGGPFVDHYEVRTNGGALIRQITFKKEN
jgi:hypothetical protein